jgi:spore germination protein KC
MRRGWGVLLALALLAAGLTGCWDIKYLDDLGIVMGLGLDQGKDGKYRVTVQIVNPGNVATGGGQKGGGSNRSPVVSYSETGNSVMEAVRKVSAKISRKLYFSHNQILVIGEDMARRGIGQAFEFIERDHEIRTDFYVLVAKGAQASDVLTITTPIEKIPANKIRDNIDNMEENLGIAYGVTVKDLVEDMGTGRRQIAVGTVEVIGNETERSKSANAEEIRPESYLKFGGMAVFKAGRLAGYLPFKSSRGFVYMAGKIQNTVIDVPCGKSGYVSVEVVHSSTDMKAEVRGGHPEVRIHVEQEANIGEIMCPEIGAGQAGTFRELEQKVNREVEREMRQALKRARDWNSDYLGLANVVYRADPQYWKRARDRWDEIFPKLPVRIEVLTEIRREGTRNESFYRKAGESKNG